MAAPIQIDLRPESHREFYALVGMCVTQYQGVEDVLAGMFASALGGPSERAAAVFSIANGLQVKFALITAVMLDLHAETRGEWQAALIRIQRAADVRNKIAHGRSTLFGGVIEVQTDDNGEALSLRQKTPARMQMQKRSKTGAVQVIEIAEMRNAYAEMEDLWKVMVALIGKVRKERASRHVS